MNILKKTMMAGLAVATLTGAGATMGVSEAEAGYRYHGHYKHYNYGYKRTYYKRHYVKCFYKSQIVCLPRVCSNAYNTRT